MVNFSSIIGFDWDTGNTQKNWLKHSVHWTECEEVFFNKPLIIGDDKKHSESEKRFFLLGRTNDDRKLFVVFTIRHSKIRIISARDMSIKERVQYEKNS